MKRIEISRLIMEDMFMSNSTLQTNGIKNKTRE